MVIFTMRPACSANCATRCSRAAAKARASRASSGCTTESSRQNCSNDVFNAPGTVMKPLSAMFSAVFAAVVFASCAHSAAAAAPAAWPTRPVRILVGFPGGSTPDIAARVLAEPLARALGQPVVVDNKPGASGNIAADAVAKATDDHTLGIVINGNLTSSKMLYPKLPYDPAKDFTYLSLIATAPLVLVAQNNLPSGADFI